METAIISALIAAGSAIIVSVINSHAQMEKIRQENRENTKEIMAELDKHNAVQDERILSLTEKINKHNSVIERTYVLENKTAVMAEQIKALEMNK